MTKRATPVVRLLGEARAALERDDPAAALTALPAAWRACKHPRIAELIDRVGAEVDARRGPIPGATVKARLAAWHVIEDDHDPADLGRLLGELWPANGKLGLECHRKLAKWPDDPRMPRALIRLPRRGYAGRAALWTVLCKRVVAIGDPRIVPELAKLALPRETRLHLRVLREQAPPAWTPRHEELVAAMEQRYATEARRARAQARGEPEMLAAIYAAPDDLALRDVFADWLAEHDDPRGELIALQRARSAGRATAKSEARERDLLHEHGDRWAEPLTKLLDARIFENGFVAAGRLRSVTGWRATAKRVDPNTRHPAWRLVRRLDVGVTDAVLGRVLDDLPHLEGIVGTSARQIAELARGPTRALRELGTCADGTLPLDRLPLPALRTLALPTDSPMVARLPKLALAARLERVTLVGFAPTPAVVAALLALPRLVELVAYGYDRASFAPDPTLAPHGFEIRIARDRHVRGAFHKSKVYPGAQAPFGEIVARFLAALPGDLRSLAIAPSPALRGLEEHDELARATARFARAERLELPWVRDRRRLV